MKEITLDNNLENIFFELIKEKEIRIIIKNWKYKAPLTISLTEENFLLFEKKVLENLKFKELIFRIV
jgi:hypothetical protein